MRILPLATIVIFTGLTISGCTSLSTTEQRVLSGGAIGAGAGVLGTALTGGCITCGAVIGGAAGAATGLIVDRINDD